MLFFCIPKMPEFVKMLKDAIKHLPTQEAKFILDFESPSFAEINANDLVVVYYHRAVFDHEAKDLLEDYRKLIGILEAREATIGIFHSNLSDSSITSSAKPSKVAFEISVSDAGFITKLAQEISIALEELSGKDMSLAAI